MQSSGNVPSAPARSCPRRYRGEEITAGAVSTGGYAGNRGGLDALPWRSSSVSKTASLYRLRVARKDELIDLMVDAQVMGNDLHFEIRGEWRRPALGCSRPAWP